MDKVRARIQKTAKWLNVVCIVAKGLLILLMAVTCGQLAMLYAGKLPVGEATGLLGDSLFFALLRASANLDALAPIHQKGIELFIIILSLGVLLLFVNYFRRSIRHIIDGEQPFTLATARSLRRASFAMLVLALNNPVLGIVLCLVTLFFSHLFEYGAYLQEKADATTRIQEEIIVSFAEITENKSGQTGQHIRRVSEYSRVLAEAMGYGEDETENLRLASIMHDIGKLLVPAEILEKPARLTDEEFAEIKKHTTYGGQLLDHVEGDVMVLARTVALEHHERPDGRGYPRGLSGEDISLAGRIVAVADVYDALTSRRSYKDAWKPSDAYDEILKCAGTQFDPAVVEAFVRAYPRIDAIRQKYADKN